jgi:hypothetical protein
MQSRLAGLGVSTEHFMLDQIGKTAEMDGKPIKQLPLRAVDGEVADQSAFRRVTPKLFELLLIILHGGSGDSVRQSR